MTKIGLNHDFWWYFTVISHFELIDAVLEQNTKNGLLWIELAGAGRHISQLLTVSAIANVRLG